MTGGEPCEGGEEKLAFPGDSSRPALHRRRAMHACVHDMLCMHLYPSHESMHVLPLPRRYDLKDGEPSVFDKELARGEEPVSRPIPVPGPLPGGRGQGFGSGSRSRVPLPRFRSQSRGYPIGYLREGDRIRGRTPPPPCSASISSPSPSRRPPERVHRTASRLTFLLPRAPPLCQGPRTRFCPNEESP